MMMKRRESTNRAPNLRNKTTMSSFHVRPTPKNHSKLERSPIVRPPQLLPTKWKMTAYPRLLSRVDKARFQMLQRNPIQVSSTTKKHILRNKKSYNYFFPNRLLKYPRRTRGNLKLLLKL
jgi:hypothetical protein